MIEKSFSKGVDIRRIVCYTKTIEGGSKMLDIILIGAVVIGWAVAMAWAYKDNGGMKEFKKSFKKVLDKTKDLW